MEKKNKNNQMDLEEETQNLIPKQQPIQQKQMIRLDPKALEILQKNFERKIAVKEYNFNDEILHIPTRYIPGEIIGSGAYGIILSATDTQNNNQMVAIKKVKSISDNIDLKRITREILIMKYCQHENIIKYNTFI